MAQKQQGSSGRMKGTSEEGRDIGEEQEEDQEEQSVSENAPVRSVTLMLTLKIFLKEQNRNSRYELSKI